MTSKSVHKLQLNANCSASMRVDATFHAKIRRLMKQEMKEHGGDSVLRFDKGLIMPASMQVGEFDRVDLRRGVIDWHTHPAKCQKAGKECTIGLPSPADMANVVVGVGFGTLAHLVYSREGTYVVQVKYKMRALLLRDSMFRKLRERQVGEAFTAVYKEFNKVPHETFRAGKRRKVDGKAMYAAFTRAFYDVADGEGFCVTLFKGDAVPQFRLHYNCGAISAGPGLTATYR